MQHFSNPVIATNEGIIIRAVLGFKEEWCVVVFIIIIIIIIIINLPYMSMSVKGTWPFEQTLNPVSTVGSAWNLIEIGQLISEESVFSNIMTLYMFTT